MFYHIKELQYEAKPCRPNPAYANLLQEILGGQYGEISVMMQYLFQGFNGRADKKFRDLCLDIGTMGERTEHGRKSKFPLYQ